MALFIDIHTHLDQYDPGELPGILSRATDAGVGVIVAAGVTLAGTRRCIDLAVARERVFAGAGVHPQDLERDLDGGAIEELTRLAARGEVVVMSEIGLDYQARSPDRDMQRRAFRAQIGVARELGLPVVFHMREATGDTLRILGEEGAAQVGGAAHYFQGTWDDAAAIMDLGFYISLAKPLLRLPELQAVASRLPLSSVVLETDCYPQPFKAKRSKWTEPKDVSLVAGKLAEIKGITVDEVREATTANALKMLGSRGSAIAPLVGAAGS